MAEITFREVQLDYDSLLATKEDEKPAIKGNLISVVGDVEVEGRDNYVWYVPLGGSNPSQVLNRKKVTLKDGLPIKVGIVEGTKEEVLGVDSSFNDSISGLLDASIGVHGSEHGPGGGDMIWIDPRQLLEFAVYPADGLFISISYGYYQYGNATVRFSGLTNIDISGSQPLATEHIAVGVYIDLLTNTALTVDGTAVLVGASLIEPTWPVNSLPIAIVDLDGTQTSLSFANDIMSVKGTLSDAIWSRGSSGDIYYNSGDVGIGVNPPLAKLHLSGGDALFESGVIIGGTNVVSVGDGAVVFDTEAAANAGMQYRPQESAVFSNGRYFVRFDLTDDASFPFLTNRTPNGAVVIKTGTAAGGGENEHFRIEGGNGVVNAYFQNTQLGVGTTSPSVVLHLGGSTGELLRLDDSSATGNPFMTLFQDGTRRSFIQHLDTANELKIASEYGSVGIYPGSAGVEARVVYVATNGLLINDTLNGFMSKGITINQGANDNELLAGKSSDVATGMTALTETDTFITLSKAIAGSGGAHLVGYGETTRGVRISGRYVTDTTTTTTSTVGVIDLVAQKKSGITVGNMGSGAIALSVRNNATSVFLINDAGDGFWGGTHDGVISDEYDDVSAEEGLISGYSALMSPKGTPARDRFKGFLQDTEEILIGQGVLSAPLTEGGMVSDTGLKMLLIDSIIQLNSKIERLEKQYGNN